MTLDLFADLETEPTTDVKSSHVKKGNKNAYDKVITKRERPKAIEQTLFGPIVKPEPAKTASKAKLKAFPIEEVMKETISYFKGDELAAKVWMTKYALKNSNGDIFELTPDDMHHRIAAEIARIDLKYPNPLNEPVFYEVLKDFEYIIPQGSPMAGIGNNFQVSSLSNCFVIGDDTPSDSYGGIMKIDQEQVQLMKRRGGVGHDLSHIRPAGSPVKNSALTSTGIVPFMQRYSNSTREVAQDGRRGALMLTLFHNSPSQSSAKCQYMF
jgi:ribonucleoside-diphosphate reductase alpha chain